MNEILFFTNVMKTIFLIDGFAVLYRAYYAFPEWKNKEWQNRNAVYGFLRMLLKRMEKKPEGIGVMRDCKEKTFRHEMAPDYKATRKKMENDFIEQIPVIQEIIKELNIFSLWISGFEADDVLASFAKKIQKNSDDEIMVYSWDKDLKQILRDRIAIVDLAKDIPYRKEDFIKEFGFEPESMVDYLALIWDSADNVKGVDGIGQKTAKNLIQKYKNLETLYESLDGESLHIKELLLKQKDNAFFAKKMIVLADVDLSQYHENDLNFSFDYERFYTILCKKYEFSSLDKVLFNLKKVYTLPQQMSLF